MARVPMLSVTRFPVCPGGTCYLEYGPDSCQAYGQPCCIAGLPVQEFICHASGCRCGACPLPSIRPRDLCQNGPHALLIARAASGATDPKGTTPHEHRNR